MTIELNQGSGGKILASVVDAAGEEHQSIVSRPQRVDTANGFTLNNTTSRTETVTTTSGSFIVTGSAVFASTDVGRPITGTGIPANAIIIKFTSTSSVTFGTPASPTYPYGQAATASGSITATLFEGFAGTYTTTRSNGVVRLLEVIGSYVSDGTAYSSTLGGTFCFQFSEDGTNPSITEVLAITNFETVRNFDLINAGEYARVLFGPNRVITSAENVFCTTTLRSHYDGAFVRRASQQIEKQNAAMGETFAYLKGYKPNGFSTDVLFNKEGQPIFGEFNVEASRGTIPGFSTVRVTGRNDAIGTTEQILSGTSAALALPTAASTVRIKSGGNANDTAAGTGAREITIVGLDSTELVVSATLATAGASASASTSQSFIRINDWYVSQCGTYSTGAIGTGANTGIVSLETTGAVLLGTIAANLGRGARAIQTIPLNKKGYFRRIRVTPEGSKAVTFRLWTRKDSLNSTAPMKPKMLRAEWVLVSNSQEFNLEHPFEMDATEEVWVTGTTGSGTSAGSCAFEILVVDD